MKETKTRVLLLEDDEGDAGLVEIAMRNSGSRIELHWVTTTTEAVTALNTQTFDIVLSDLSLPDSDGDETIKRLQSAANEVPIIVLTTLDDQELGMELLDAGAQDYMPKDCITGDLLNRAIRHAIQRQQQLVETQHLLREVQDGRDLLVAKNNKLEKLYKQAHEFVDNVSHEFRTPLTVIKEYASLVCDGLAGPVSEEQIRMLNVVEDRADDLNTMVDDMLDSSKLESGLLGAWRKPCTVSEVLSHVTAALYRKAQVKGVSLEYDIAPDLPELYCDDEKVGRVLTNLAVNAIKFCGNPGVVRIAAEPTLDNHDIMFSVTDDGPGIDEDALQRIFERFQQLDATTRGSCKGFGLGLAIAKELVDLNFGQLSVESKLGQGSTFRFTVPKNDPVELMTRYLRFVELQPECPPLISIATARVEAQTADDTRRGIDGFLNYLLRRNDLLLPNGPGEWLLALPTDAQELQNYFDRSRQAWSDANRNRPFEPLPVVEYESLGTWRIPNDRGMILEVLDQRAANTSQYTEGEIAVPNAVPVQESSPSRRISNSQGSNCVSQFPEEVINV